MIRRANTQAKLKALPLHLSRPAQLRITRQFTFVLKSKKMKLLQVSLLFLGALVLSPGVTRGANILFFSQTNNYSHKVNMWPLAEALANRGHNVTFIFPLHYKVPNPKIKEIVPLSLETQARENLIRLFDVQVRFAHALTPLVGHLFEYGYVGCVTLYDAPEFQEWLLSKPEMDLVIADNCMAAECGAGVAYKLGAKLMIFSTIVAFPHEYDSYGYLPESSAVPELETWPSLRPMTFWTRISNTLMSIRWHWAYSREYAPKIDKLIRDKLQIGPEMPFIGDFVSDNVSLVLYTGDVVTDYPRTQPPNYVNVGGMHCKDSDQPLPQDLEDFVQTLDNGDPSDGFVYISLGSLVNPSKLPERVQQVFFQTIESFPRLKFLWRWDSEFPKKHPKNLLFSKWLPQNDLLGHAQIRAFVTQGGRPSTIESVFHGVPTINFPILGDQEYNGKRIEDLGGSIKLEIVTVTKEEFRAALSKAVYDPTMKTRMTHLKNVFRDRPNSPLDTALWWTEYVLRVPDTQHLRPAGHNQSWFVRRQIDVWAFLTVMFLLGAYCCLHIFGKLVKLFFGQDLPQKQKRS